MFVVIVKNTFTDIMSIKHTTSLKDTEEHTDKDIEFHIKQKDLTEF